MIGALWVKEQAESGPILFVIPYVSFGCITPLVPFYRTAAVVVLGVSIFKSCGTWCLVYIS